YVFRLAAHLRAAGLRIGLDGKGRSLKAQANEADRQDARFAVIVGKDARAAGEAQLKGMASGAQRAVPAAAPGAASRSERPPRMCPRLSDLLLDLFGIDFPLPLYSFGLMVATAILTAPWLLRRELDRMYAAGIVGPVDVKEPGKHGRTKIVKASPSVLVWTIMLMAAFFGILGSKLFHILENLPDFFRDPAGMLFSSA